MKKTTEARAAHTPGPWHRNIKPARHYSTIFAGRCTHVARLATDGLTDGEIEANCNLIAAAPELLAALRAVAGIGGNLDDERLTTRTGPNDAVQRGLMYCEARRLALAAIAKAEGRRP